MSIPDHFAVVIRDIFFSLIQVGCISLHCHPIHCHPCAYTNLLKKRWRVLGCCPDFSFWQCCLGPVHAGLAKLFVCASRCSFSEFTCFLSLHGAVPNSPPGTDDLLLFIFLTFCFGTQFTQVRRSSHHIELWESFEGNKSRLITPKSLNFQ
jgi:hypothetical protein